MPQERKVGRQGRRSRFAGGNYRGVLTTDPSGQQVVLPFDDGSAGFLSSNGSFGTPASGAVWGSITGTLSNQTDLQAALNAKQDLLVWDNDLGVYLINR